MLQLRSSAPRRRASMSTSLLGLGTGLVALGVALPWLTLFRGLSQVPGFVLEGGPLAGFALAAAGAILVAQRVGGGRALRLLAVALASFVVADAALVATRIAAYVAEPGPTGPLAQPAIGPGAFVTVLGAALLVGAALLARARTTAPLTIRRRAWLVLGGLLLVAGWVHLLLAPEHLEASPILGAGFVAAGLAELGLAALAAFRPSVGAAFATIGICVALVALYAYAVLHGLPFPDQHAGTTFGAAGPEGVDATGLATKLAELASIGLSFALLGAPQARSTGSRAPASPAV